MAGLDETTTMLSAFEAAFPNDELVLVKDAQSGQPIRRWYKDWKPVGDWTPKNKRSEPGNNDLYQRLMESVNSTISSRTIHTISFIWMQGEADAKAQQSSNYEESLARLISQLRTDLNRPDVTAVIGRISDHQLDDPHWLAIRQAQINVAEKDALVEWIDTDELNGNENGLHYNRSGYDELGTRFAQKSIALVQKSQHQ